MSVFATVGSEATVLCTYVQSMFQELKQLSFFLSHWSRAVMESLAEHCL